MDKDEALAILGILFTALMVIYATTVNANYGIFCLVLWLYSILTGAKVEEIIQND